jgi:hypothetical protein
MHNVCSTEKAILFQITKVSILLALPPSTRVKQLYNLINLNLRVLLSLFGRIVWSRSLEPQYLAECLRESEYLKCSSFPNETWIMKVFQNYFPVSRLPLSHFSGFSVECMLCVILKKYATFSELKYWFKTTVSTFFFTHDCTTPVVLGHIVVEVYWAHHVWYDSSGRVFGPSPRNLPDKTKHSQEIDFNCVARFEPAVPGNKRVLTHTLDLAATGIVQWKHGTEHYKH